MSIYLDQIRSEQDQYLCLFSKNPANLVIKSPCGLGKTRAAIKQLCFPGCSVGIYVSTHQLAKQYCRDIRDICGPDITIKILSGRGQSINGIPMCQRNDETKQYINKKESVFKAMCQDCPFYDKCLYIQNIQTETDVTIHMHANLPLSRTRIDQPSEETVILDETFWKELVGTISISKTAILNCPQYSEELTETILNALEGSDFVSDMVSSKKELRESRKDMEKGTSMHIFTGELLRAISKRRPNLICVNGNEIEIARSKTLARRLSGSKVLIIDADVDHDIIKEFIPGIDMVELTAPMNGGIIQTLGNSFGKTQLNTENSNPHFQQNAKDSVKELNVVIDRIVEEYGPAAVFTYKKLLTEIEVPDGSELINFGALRGSNKWEKYNVAIVIGRNMVNVREAERLARAVYRNSPDAIQVCKGKLPMKILPNGLKAPNHPDPRVNGIINQILKETSQALGRVRPLADGPFNHMFVLCDTDVGIDPDILVPWKQFKNPSKAEKIYARLGMVPCSPLFLVQEFPELFKDINAAKKWRLRHMALELAMMPGLVLRGMVITPVGNSKCAEIYAPGNMPIIKMQKAISHNKTFMIL